MEKAIIQVEGMSCEHCVKAVTDCVTALVGVVNASVDLGGKTATVEYDPSQCSLEKIKQEIEEQGYDVVG